MEVIEAMLNEMVLLGFAGSWNLRNLCP